MKWLLLLLSLAASNFTGCLDVPGKDGSVDYRAYDRYFAKGDSGLKGPASYLAIATRSRFDAVFGHGSFGYGDGKDDSSGLLPVDAFASRLVVAVIKRGGEWWDYQVQGVTSSGDRLTVRYTARRHDGQGAEFASPLVVSVSKGDYRTVVFVEDGTEVGTARVDDIGQ